MITNSKLLTRMLALYHNLNILWYSNLIVASTKITHINTTVQFRLLCPYLWALQQSSPDTFSTGHTFFSRSTTSILDVMNRTPPCRYKASLGEENSDNVNN